MSSKIMIKYPASYARMRGLKGKLLGKHQLEVFLQSSDYQSVLSMLKNSAYNEQIPDTSDILIIEHALKQDLIVAYRKILVFLRGKPAHLIETLLGRFELLNVKSIIRSFAKGLDPKEETSSLIFSLGKYHTIPIDDVLDAKNLESCISLMKNTPFERPLEIGYQEYESSKRLFPLEIALDIDYYRRLKEALDGLNPFDRYNAGIILGIQYDITNLLWMLRFKQYYKLTSEQIFQYMLPYGWKLRPEVFLQISSDSNTWMSSPTFIKPYDQILKTAMNSDSNYILGAEIYLLRYLYNESVKSLLKFPLQASSFIAFFIMKEMEIRDIISILAGKNLDIPPEKIRDYMITF